MKVLRWLATGIEWAVRIVGGAAVGIYAIVGVGLIGLLVVSLALHALGIWKTPPEHEPRHHHQRSAYEPSGYPEGTGYPDEAYEGEFDPTPEKINGEDSHEFEPDDIERAEEADEELREYCEGAVSPAQELGCLSHAEVP